MTTWITICDTCKRDDWEARAPGVTDGETFADLIEAAAEGTADVRTRRHSCLMGCARGCNVAIQGPGKLNYTVGEFDPSVEAAEAVVEYASLHAQSETGQVPYKQWPQAIKGHFATRHPPLPSDD
ncbi:DUF1636 family protein [Litoreibacter albidus]|uniref:Predicted metal-binding protein n=1 Tax=Litoreibacter albidus TaxID=670155 RepID=A0A1H2VDV9_9RHOB|nr:DUF1636 domain-containing protein [Litoreibacter albidus]SDW66059.1 Predicted metal-binding protein [Litoreibacter albidus]